MKFKVACATDGGKKFNKDHFGDAKYYLIYIVSNNKIKLLDRIQNPKHEHKHTEENISGDPKKAKKISEILKNNAVNVMFGYQIGLNIVRMKKKFVPVISRDLDINKSLKDLQKILDKVEEEYNKGEIRTHIILKNN